MKYSKVSFGQAEAVFNKLGGEQGILDFLSGKTQVVKSDKNFATFMNIQVGLYDSNELVKIIKKDKNIITKESENILDWTPIFGYYEREIIELVVTTPMELGFETMFESCATYENICERAEKYGLDKCPPETGILLSLPQFKLKNEFYIVASELLKDKIGNKHLLVPWYHSDGICNLQAWKVNEDEPYDKNFNFIFVRRKMVLC